MLFILVLGMLEVLVVLTVLEVLLVLVGGILQRGLFRIAMSPKALAC